MMEIKVKWGKETLTMEVEPSSTLLVLKQHIAARTAVPVEKQKIMGLKSTRDEGVLTEIGLVAGKTIMLIGTAEGTVVPTVLAAEAVAAEEATSGSATNEMPKGLRNIANTCYFNAAIQMLRTMPEIKEILAEYKGTDALMVQLGRLLNQLDSNSTTEVVPAAMWTALMQEFPNFAERDEHGGFMQHDAQEVVNVLLQEMVSILPKKYMHLFMGNMRHQKTCPEDPEDVMKEDFSPFSMLGCNIAGEAQTLEAGLESSFKEQFSIHNERLGKEAGITRTTLVSTLPEYLFVHMERFAWKSDIQKKAKILKPISFPIVLDTAIVMTDELKQSVKAEREVIMARRDKEVERRKRGRFESKEAEEEAPPVENVPTELHNESGFYELCSVVSHKGRSAEGGHYVCWTKKNEQWFVIDDHNVAAVTEEDVKRLRGVGEAHIAYVLLYRSRNPITHKPVVPS